MKLLVLAQTPPPLHGQSLMVRTLVDGLPALGIGVHHVNLRLSRDGTDIGRWRPGKIWATLSGALQAVFVRFRHGCDTLYYVPAPGKRGALYRDWLVMLICRPFFRRLVLHWHATGLGTWLETHATAPERTITRWLLGRADLSIVLSPALRADAEYLHSRRIAVVANGIADPGPPPAKPARPAGAPCEVLFLGLGSYAKGLFDTLEAVALANARAPGAFHVTVAGGFGSVADRQEFQARLEALGGAAQYAGFADETQKHALLARADIFCFPTNYPHEGQPLSLIEALAHDVRIVTTRWRGIPDMLPAEHVWYVQPHEPAELSLALEAAAKAPPPGGALRQHFLAHFTIERHLGMLADMLTRLAE